MITLSNALAQVSTAGEPLPPLWPEFVQQGVSFRQGNLVVIAAGPGGNKSVLAMNLVVRSGVPALYVSADTDQFTTGLRAAALMSGDPLPRVEAAMKTPEGEKYRRLIEQISRHVQWVFDGSPSIDDIRDEVEAFGLVYGCFPQLIVIDNLMNIYSDEEDHTAMRHNIEAFNILARESGACVVVLHHLVGEYESGEKPPSLSALIGKVGKMPSLVLTLFRGQFGDLGVCICKNRYGPADPRGNLRVYLSTNPEKARIG